MKKLTATLCLTIAVLLGSMGMSASADFQKGFTAYFSGDYENALREWKPLAEQGHISAQYGLGLMYRDGNGVPKNYKTAVKWFRLAAKQGNAAAQTSLGVMYAQGQGITENDKTAFKWFRLAAEQGNADAQYSLGLMYGTGQGVIQDWVYAHMWGNLSASIGSESGGELRDLAAKEMTPAQIAEAQKLARECVRKKYKGC